MRVKLPGLLAISLITFVVLLALFGGISRGQDAGTLAYGDNVSGAVTDRLGEEWSFDGCAGDVVTITMRSAEFDVFLQLFGPTERDSLEENDNLAAGVTDAEIGGFRLPESGPYTIVAAGSSVRERGGYSLTLVVSDTTSLAGAPAILSGQPVTGSVTSRFGDEYTFRGCAQNTVTITLESRAFIPFLELFPPVGRDPLAVGEESQTSPGVAIEGILLPETGSYTVVASGSRIRDRGPYTLTVEMAIGAPATETVPITPTVTVTVSAVQEGATSSRCAVASTVLNIRRGPGINFSPAIGLLQEGAVLIPRGRVADGTWIEVEVEATGQIGWVSSLPQFVTCSVAIAALPVVSSPPTPTPVPATATPIPRPTATFTPEPPQPQPQLPQPQGVVIRGPGGMGDMEGDLFTDPRFVSGSLDANENPPVFRDFFFLEAYVYDPRADSNNDDATGEGIDYVDFSISCPNGGSYEHRENTARYCIFGGGEPNCSVLRLEDGQFLPDSDCAIQNGIYDVNIRAVPEDSRRDEAEWLLSVEFQPQGTEPQEPEQPQETEPEQPQEPEPEQPQEPAPEEPSPPADLAAWIEQVGSGSTLIFQVVAYDPTVGNNDGDGIQNVDLYITGPDGLVYQRTENNAHYCAFGGGEPDCNQFDLAVNNNWPDGPEIVSGQYVLSAVVHAQDGRTVEVSPVAIEVTR